MPAYAYICKKCAEAFEVRRAMTDESPVICSTCGSRRVRRVYQALALVGAPSTRGGSGESAASDGGCCGGACGCGH